jgi:serine/threonine-protein kinase
VVGEAGSMKNGAGTGHRSYAELVDEGMYLDNSGQMNAGAAAWKTAAGAAGGVPELASTQAYMLAQGALNRALTGDCKEAKALVAETNNLPRGPVAWFHAGMAEALCGDKAAAEKAANGLRQSFPQSTAVQQYYVPEMQAAKALAAKTPVDALELLGGAANYDQLSLTPYLMGLAHMADQEPQLAVLDFETVLGHRGGAFAMGGTVYPMAESGLARASLAAGDRAKSAVAHRQLAVLWQGSDRGRTLLHGVSAKKQ